MADEEPPLTPATRTAKPVSEALLNDKVPIILILMRPLRHDYSRC